MTIPKLYYFPVYGKAEPIRMILALAKIPFEDVHLNYEEWAKIKLEKPEMFEFNQLPVFERDGKFYSQSTAITKMLAIENGFYPTKTEDIYDVESMLEGFTDWANSLLAVRRQIPGAPPFDEDTKANITTEFMKTANPLFLKVLEARLKKNGGGEFYVGDKVTIADIAMCHCYTGLFNGKLFGPLLGDSLDAFPAVKVYFEGLAEGVFKDYLKGRPAYDM